VKLPEEIKIFENVPGKNRNFLVKLPEDIEMFRKFAWKNRFFYPDARPPDFKPD